MSAVLVQVRNFMEKHGKYFDKPQWIAFHLLLQETERAQTDRPFPHDDLW